MIVLTIEEATMTSGGKTPCRCYDGNDGMMSSAIFHYTDSCSGWCCSQRGYRWEHERHGVTKKGFCANGPTNDDHKPGILRFLDKCATLGIQVAAEYARQSDDY